MRVLYRVVQFWRALTITPSPEELSQARQLLSPNLLALFLRLQASEQAHSLSVFRRLREHHETNPDLLAAALLHDVGKSRFPLRLWERVEIVLGRKLCPERAKRWGQAEARGWRRPFVIAEQHAAWGAEMAAGAGASAMTVALIGRHQEPRGRAAGGANSVNLAEPEQVSLEDMLLSRLQELDDES
ncbi:MAG: HD domain-containing protein [Anaerolineales bacterium]|nr:HD domain-containing protein [Anaerolineales bacterium]